SPRTGEKRRLFHTLSLFFARLAATGPGLLVVFEDLHWTDNTSLEFLRQFARVVPDHPILLQLTYRPEDTTPALRRFLSDLDRGRLAAELALAALSATEVGTMVEVISGAGAPAPAGFVGGLHELTG